MEKKRKKINDYDQTGITPWIELKNVEYRMFNKTQKTKEVIDTETGEVASLVYSGTTVYGYKDTNPYSKLYKSGALKLSKLSSAGLKVFCYILMNIHINKESIYLCPDTLSIEIGYANKKNVYEGIENLLANDIIARKTGNSNYWINPNMLFNGDRTKLLEDPSRQKYINGLKKTAKEVSQEYQIGKE